MRLRKLVALTLRPILGLGVIVSALFLFTSFTSAIVCPLPMNKPYLSGTSTVVHYVTNRCTIRVFPTPTVFKTWFPSFSSVKYASTKVIKRIPTDSQRTMGKKGAPEVTSFKATPNPVQPGDTVTLSWNVNNNPTAVTINNVGTVPASGSTQVTNDTAAPTTFTLSATNNTGAVTAQQTVNQPQAATSASAALVTVTNPTPYLGTATTVQAVSVTNYLKQPDALNLSPWMSSCKATPDTKGTRDTVTCSSAGSWLYQGVYSDLVGNTGPFTLSAKVATVSGTNIQSVVMNLVGGTGATSCTCKTSDSRPCTARTLGTLGFAYTSVGTQEVRLSLTCSAKTKVTLVNAGVHGGQFNFSTTPGLFGEAQLVKGSGVPTCTSFTYSAWGACQSNNTQTRTITASSPSGCRDGSPVTTQSCTNSAQQSVTSFSLINTSIKTVDGQPIAGFNPISNGTSIDTAIVGSSLSVRANTNPSVVGSVRFSFDGNSNYRLENVAPYLLCSDDTTGVITNCNLSPGTHTITATPYSLPDGGGTAGTPYTISFTVKGDVVITNVCSYTYSAWSACQANNTQTRTVLSSSPAGCTGSPVLSQSCSGSPSTLASQIFAAMVGPNDGFPAYLPNWGFQKRCIAGSDCGCWALTSNTQVSPSVGNDNARGCFAMGNTATYGGRKFNAVTAWGAIEEVGTTNSTYNTAKNTAVELRKMQMWILDSGGSWHKVQDSSQPGAYSYPHPDASGCISGSGSGGQVNQIKYSDTGTVSYRPTGGCVNAHFFPASRGDISAWSPNLACVVSLVQGRLRTVNTSLPDDRENAKYLISMGADYYPELSGSISDYCSTWPAWCPSGYPINPGSGGGRHQTVTNDWKLFAYTTCLKSTLTSNPPPIGDVVVSSVCSYTYSAWGACQANNTQTRTVLSSSPAGCTGSPVLSQACTYVPPAPSTYPINTTITGQGTLTCNGGSCSNNFSLGSVVSIVATPATGHAFGSWGGACIGISGNTCNLIVGTNNTVSATFTSATTKVNIALGKPVTGSSVEMAGVEAMFAVDGNLSTRWSSGYTLPRWIYVDLGANYDVNQVKITWEAAYAGSYEIQVSSDATNWTALKKITGNTALVNDHTGLFGIGRYLRIYITATGPWKNSSLFELEAYGTLTTGNPCLDSSWSPDSSTGCIGSSITQTSNCGATRVVNGTRICSGACTDSTWTPTTVSPTSVCLGAFATQESNCGNKKHTSGTKDCSGNATELSLVKQKSFFMSHASTGQIISDALIRNYGADWVVNTNPPAASAVTLGKFTHSIHQQVHNDYPKLKIDDFVGALNNGIGVKLNGFAGNGMAMMVYGFTDIHTWLSNTDLANNVDALFAYYKTSFETLRSRYPNIKFVHYTPPLYKQGYNTDSNVLKVQFAKKMKDEYGSAVFDIQAIESDNGAIISGGAIAMKNDCAADIGHMNSACADKVVRALIPFFARQWSSSLVAQQSVTSFSLINASIATVDGQPVAGFNPISNGAIIDTAVVGPSLSIRANTNPSVVGSVRFSFDGNSNYRLENIAPYLLCSDGAVTNCNLTPGTHTITATPYSLPDGGGTAGTPYTISFTIKASAGAPTCTSFTYSTWGTCQSNGIQTRTITSQSPTSCTGGAPSLTQTCGGSTSGVNWDQVAKDMVPYASEACIYGIPSSWGMNTYSAGVFAALPPYYSGEYYEYADPWGEINTAANCSNTSVSLNKSSNTRVHLRRQKLYLLRGSTVETATWSLVANEVPGGADYRWQPYDVLAWNRRSESEGISIKVRPGYTSHFYSGRTRYTSTPAVNPQIKGVLATFEARLIVDNASLPDDRANAAYIGNSGQDWWPNTTVSAGFLYDPNEGHPNNDGGRSHTKYVTNSWRLFTYTTLTAAQLRANPPPIDLTGVSP